MVGPGGGGGGGKRGAGGIAGCLPRRTNTGLASGATSSQSLHTHCCLMGSHLAMGCMHSHRAVKEAGWWVGGGGGGVVLCGQVHAAMYTAVHFANV